MTFMMFCGIYKDANKNYLLPQYGKHQYNLVWRRNKAGEILVRHILDIDYSFE